MGGTVLDHGALYVMIQTSLLCYTQLPPAGAAAVTAIAPDLLCGAQCKPVTFLVFAIVAHISASCSG
jgi:hypothetical protein